ncbi:hypothetical protein [Ensifer sp. BR816]|uniref:hypothetical protein n=1 Tax=Rhizobium sp. (strain BR816) TaxID=1057002 RepID=UPI0012F935EF|nr:hypothetical protein [Ensifer sp. BR816]
MRQELFDELAALKEPSRRIDQAIAELFKYRRETKNVTAQGARQRDSQSLGMPRKAMKSA